MTSQWSHLMPPADEEQNDDLPFVTMSYAQSIDGSIATSRRKALPISSDSSMLMTHALRAGHEAILVGVGTIVSDDPQLNARFPRLAPRQPQPVVLDPDLRCPATARILRIAKPWIYCNASADAERAALLEALGASVTRIVNPSSMHEKLDIAAVLRHVRSRGIKSVMIEGGATIIGQLYQSQLVHRVIITIAPVVVGGLHISTEPGSLQHGGGLFRKLHNVRYDIVESDIVVSGFLSPHLSQLTK